MTQEALYPEGLQTVLVESRRLREDALRYLENMRDMEANMLKERDLWVHRSSGMRCKTCMYYAVKASDPVGEGYVRPPELGRCRRHAPTMGGYPVVFPTDWCGDHKLSENTISGAECPDGAEDRRR